MLLLLPAVITCAALTIAAFVLLPRRKPLFNGPTEHWFTGHLGLLTHGKLHENLIAVSRQQRHIWSMRIFGWRYYVASHPAVVTRLLKSGPKVAVKRSEAYWMFDQMTNPRSRNVLSAADDDPYWKVVRTAAAQAFATKNLKVLFEDIVASTREGLQGPVVTAALQQHQGVPPHRAGTVDVDALFLRITVDILGSFLRGRGFGAAGGAPCPALQVVANECKVVAECVKHPFRHWLLWKQEVRDELRWNREFAALIRSMLAELQASPPPAHTLASRLLASKDPHTGGPLPELRLRAELGVFLMAGFETTGHATAIALFAIIAHPEVETRVCEELEELGLLASPARPTPRVLQWEDLGKLRVLSAAVQESMRWLPPAPLVTMRVLRQDTELLGTMVPKGTGFWLPLICIHRDPRTWERPDDYDINRWLEGDGVEGGLMAGLDDADNTAEGSRGARGYLPFSEGPRNCVGQALARVEVLVVLALLLGSFRVELAPEMGGRQGVLDSLDVKMALRPEGGLWCHLAPRVPT